jgi:hypothetical protein
MKKLIPAVLFLFISAASLAQPALKIYGYSQSHVAGMVPEGTHGTGATDKYYVYLQHKVSDKVTTEAIWIKGKKTVFSEQTVTAPVVHINRNLPQKPVKTTFVPGNGYKTIAFNLKSAVAATPSTVLKKLISENELVIQYNWKGRRYYKTLKKLTVIEPWLEE